jgi:S-formylglutathione hydrolase FrmB
MNSTKPSPALVLFCIALSLVAACNRKQQEPAPDHPRLTSKVVLRDITFPSAALHRDMQYRAIFPASLAAGEKLPVVYLLHGGGGGFHDWSNYSAVAGYAEQNLILVMPEGNSSYYTNSATRPDDRYEDYIATDLIADVENRFPAASGRSNRAIVGVSMGGFGAVKIALRHPELYSFAAGLSPALDVPSRPFSIKRIEQWRFHSSIFGPWGSPSRRDNDPFVLARSADPTRTPYLFLTCGEQEGLLPTNRAFAALLEKRHFQYEFHTTRGGHDWNQWNGWLPDLFPSLLEHIKHPAIERQATKLRAKG